MCNYYYNNDVSVSIPVSHGSEPEGTVEDGTPKCNRAINPVIIPACVLHVF